jgi:hypothetical protein
LPVSPRRVTPETFVAMFASAAVTVMGPRSRRTSGRRPRCRLVAWTTTRGWLTGYWLHLDVRGNPRLSDRMRQETFEFRDTVGKWIEGKGLPYAIVEDLAALPRDARVDMIPLREFPPAALVQNARPGSQNARPGSDPNSSLCRVK